MNEGGRITKSASDHVSNVRLYSEEDGRGYRVGHRFVGQDEALYASKEAVKRLSPRSAKRLKGTSFPQRRVERPLEYQSHREVRAHDTTSQEKVPTKRSQALSKLSLAT